MPAKVIRPADRHLESIHPNEPAHPNASVRKQVLSAADPYAHLIEVPPGHAVLSHSHSEPEVTVVLSGSLVIDGTACASGSVLVVPADERYAFCAGPDEPLTFLVLRPRPSTNDLHA
jgi:quercetin dioxygenase-like cupin family protein